MNGPTTGQRQDQDISVLLTGSTGALGTYLLELLLAVPGVRHIVCLNRTADAPARQAASLKARGLRGLTEQSNVDFLHADLAAPLLGLTANVYQDLLQSTTAVLHNGWPVDFNLAFESFGPSIQGVRNLVQFAYECRQPCSFFFVSSMSIAGNWGSVPGALEKVPEIELDDWRLARNGYGQSKLVAETLLAEASRISGIDVSICRVCQVAGPILYGENGYWNHREWLPSLISTSEKLGLVPEHMGPLETNDWVPIDVLARIMMDIFITSTSSGYEERHQRSSRRRFIRKTKRNQSRSPRIFHIANPRTATWSALLPTIRHHFGTGVKPVPLVEWIDALIASANTSHASQLSGLKLLDFFENLKDKAVRFPRAKATMLDTKETRKLSATLDSVQPVSAEWVDLWMRQWKASGMIRGVGAGT